MPFSIWILNETHRQSFSIVYTNQILKPNTTSFYIFYYFIICMKYIYIYIYIYIGLDLFIYFSNFNYQQKFTGASSYID